MLNFKKQYFALEPGRIQYPINFDNLENCEVYGAKDFVLDKDTLGYSAPVYKIPKEYYIYNSGNIDFGNFPDGIENFYTHIKIINYQDFFNPGINFITMGDITPENLETMLNEIKKHILELENALISSYLFIDSQTPNQNNFPELPPGCTWFHNPVTRTIEALPVSEMYQEFEKLRDYLYKEIKKLLLKFKQEMSEELKQETDNLLKELEKLKNTLTTEMKEYKDNLKKEISNHTNDKKVEINDYVTLISKPDINEFVDDEKVNFTRFVEEHKESLKGEKGDTGERGEIGPIGPMGNSIKGDKGDQGEKGADGVVITAKGEYAFQITDGDLILHYTGDVAPKYKIDESGCLIKEV